MTGVLLVTGAGGFIGRHVVRVAQERGLEVATVPHAWRSLNELADAVGTVSINRCLHLAWYAAPADYLVSEPSNVRSLTASLEVIELLRTKGCQHLVVAGSSAEYAVQNHPLRETDRIAPWSVYGAAKHALHVLLRSSFTPEGMSVAWARIFNVTGPGEPTHRLLPATVRSLARGDRMEITDGAQFRDFLHVEDVAAGLLRLSEPGVDGTFNLCSGVPKTLRQVLEGLAERVGQGSLLFGARRRPQHDAEMVVGDNRALTALGWSPKYDFEATLDAVVASALKDSE